MKMTNKQYDTLKFFALLILPISAFVGKIASIWGLPYGEQIVATLIALDVLVGALVKIAADNYHEGDE